MLERILEPVVRWIIAVISGTGYPGIVFCMAIESACIPLPSEIIMPFSGYLAYVGRFNLWWASLAGALGCLIGSVLAYGVGVWGGRPFIERYGRYVLLSKHDLDVADRWFTRWGDWAVFVSRLLPIVRTFISLPAGIARMNFVRFMIYSFVGSVPWCLFLAWVGKVLGENWASIRVYFRRADIFVAAAILALFALWLYRHLKGLKATS
jgi:membrane protein DedA with SNARE-associated domain